MTPLDRPQISAEESFTKCISRVKDTVLKARLQAATTAIVDFSDVFNSNAESGTVHRVAREPIVDPDVTTEEMEAIYTGRMAKIGAPGRSIYDRIISAAGQGRCPLCSQRQVSTIDHYLPKFHYPALAVSPLNLIPSCIECNKAKLASFPVEAQDAPLHPYYDNLGDTPWLWAEVVETSPSALRYYVNPPEEWGETIAERVKNHFRILGLARLYASEAAEELVNIRNQLVGIRKTDSISGVQMELHRRYISCKLARSNGWRTVAYRAWSTSDWFCSIGLDF